MLDIKKSFKQPETPKVILVNKAPEKPSHVKGFITGLLIASAAMIAVFGFIETQRVTTPSLMTAEEARDNNNGVVEIGEEGWSEGYDSDYGSFAEEAADKGIVGLMLGGSEYGADKVAEAVEDLNEQKGEFKAAVTDLLAED